MLSPTLPTLLSRAPKVQTTTPQACTTARQYVPFGLCLTGSAHTVTSTDPCWLAILLPVYGFLRVTMQYACSNLIDL